jgi:hypothetical protein
MVHIKQLVQKGSVVDHHTSVQLVRYLLLISTEHSIVGVQSQLIL